MTFRSRLTLVTMAVGMGVSILLAAAGAPVLVILPAMLLVMGPAALMYAWLDRQRAPAEARIKIIGMSAGMAAALLAGCYGWPPIGCVGVAVVVWLATVLVMSDRERQRARERDR